MWNLQLHTWLCVAMERWAHTIVENYIDLLWQPLPFGVLTC